MEVSGPVIELRTLAERHPRAGDALLNEFGAHVVLRLSFDPVRLPAGTLKRAVRIGRTPSGAPGTRSEELREVGWEGLEGRFTEDDFRRVLVTRNEQDITMGAAVGVMLLLIHELEEMTMETVLPIGSGGDYLVCRKGTGESFQVEVSGIRVDADGSEASSRLGKKCEQVLRHCPAGFVSVTTFQYGGRGEAHSYLCYVTVSGKPKTKRGGKGRGRPRKRKGQ
jgi:hypothetical protein